MSDPTPNARARVAATACGVCGQRDAVFLFHKQGYDFVRCGECRAVRIDPLPAPETLVGVYDALYKAGSYVGFAAADHVRLATAAARLAAVRPFTGDGPWLDVGCSTGAFLRAGVAAGLDIEGIDVSETAVATARAAGLRATASPIENFTPARPYAVITAFDLVEHLLAPAAFLERARDWLLPGGRLVTTVPDIGSIHARLMGSHWYYYAPPLHVHYFDRPALLECLTRTGFRAVHVAAAPKVLTLAYAVEGLNTYNPWIGRAAGAVVGLLPAGLRGRPLPMPVGELLAVAART